MTTYIDADSLLWGPAPTSYRDAVLALVQQAHPESEVVTNPIRLLAQLREGAGVTVVCGPRGIPFWKGVSHEVRVRVEPDGYDVRGRTVGMQWALEAQGVKGTDAARLVKNPPKLTTHGYMKDYLAATALLSTLESVSAETLIESTVPVSIVKEDIALDLLEGFKDRAGRYGDEDPLALDWEYNKKTHALVGLNITAPIRRGDEYREENLYIPVRGADYTAPASFGPRLQAAVAALHDAGVYTVYHNGKSDLSVCAPEGRDPLTFYGSPIHDTIVMAYVLGYGELGLKELTLEVLGRYAQQYPGELEDLPIGLAARYGAAGDTKNTLDLYRALREALIERDQWGVYDKIERPIVPLVASMEWAGQPVRADVLAGLSADVEQTLRGLEQHVWQKCRIDISSDKGQLEFLTRMLGYNPGTVSNDKLATKSEEAWLDTHIGYRKLNHSNRAFLVKHRQRWERAGRPLDFRAYSSFNQAGSADERDERTFKRAARTGRFTSSSLHRDGVEVGFGNLQNQPGLIRAAFVAPACPVHGYETDFECWTCFVFWSLDYSGLEMRIGAAMSGDPEMLRVLLEQCPDAEDNEDCPHTPKHGDPHGQFQYKVFELVGILIERTIAKNWNFGSNYGAGPDTQMKTLAKARAFIDYVTAQMLDKAHHEAYATYHAFNKTEQVKAVERGYSETYFGRRRYDPDLRSADSETLGHAKRAAGNMPVQGTAADLMKIVMGESVPILLRYNAHLSMQVHDEIAGWVPAPVAAAFIEEMKALMQSKKIKGLPMKVSGGFGHSWAEVH